MKVILAGYPKTGTKSMETALEILGFNVSGPMENLFRLGKEWSKILNVGGTVEDFRQMYQDVDATSDVPSCLFWEEILEAFPDSKIILTMRNSDEEWVESLANNMNTVQGNFAIKLFRSLSPTEWQLQKNITKPMLRIAFGITLAPVWKNTLTFNKCLAKKKYRIHNAHVLENAPKDQLLVYQVSEGWEPLCKFLEVPVPDQPFPHKNIRGDGVKDWVAKDPIFQKMKREVFISLSLLSLLMCFASYKIITGSPKSLFNSVIDQAKYMISFEWLEKIWHN